MILRAPRSIPRPVLALPCGSRSTSSTRRLVAASDAAALRLAELHHPFVRVVDKAYKGVPRKEVVVSWKKALKSGGGL